MGEKKIKIIEGLDEVSAAPSSVVAVCISGSRKSRLVVEWALDKFVPEGFIYFKLLHIRSVISRIRTPMGHYVPISQVRDEVAAAFRKEVEWQVTEKLLPCKTLCRQRKVQVEIVQIESDDVADAICEDILKNKISKLVIGASPRSILSRGQTLSSKISECCPTFCSVYSISKGKLSSLRPSDSETTQSFRDDSSDTSCSTDSSTIHTSSSQADTMDQGYAHFHSASLPMQRCQALSAINQAVLYKRMPSSGAMYVNILPFDAKRSNRTNIRTTRSDVNNYPLWNQLALPSETSAKNQDNIKLELEKLRTELRHVRGMYAMAQGEAMDASRKLNEIQRRHLEEETNLKQLSCMEEEAKELAKKGKERYEAAKREAKLVKECVDREVAERKDAELKVCRETKEKENLQSVLDGSFHQYRLYTWEEIITASSSFSDELKLGTGAYGTVYKCTFQHTTAALKLLHAKEDNRTKEFQQELDILSQIRHPHLLILLGACPDRSCLIYEFMENGSLEDRLNRKNNNAPLPWFDRVRIAWEVASALAFLHNSKPRGIIHRDLKPGNILLDRNYVSKIGDVGLSTVVNKDSLSSSMMYKDTAPVGTLCYIDPEYQRTGVVSPKSDVYAFGIVMLQLLTAKPAIALSHIVETAIENDNLMEILDPEANDWPIEEAKDLAVIALKCTELRQKDRPDLQDVVLPALEKLKDSAEKRGLVSAPPPPKHFTCPILNEVMSDPCVAADGFTYDRKVIEAWFQEKDTSPMTGLPLEHKYLIPNFALLSAIMEWKS